MDYFCTEYESLLNYLVDKKIYYFPSALSYITLFKKNKLLFIDYPSFFTQSKLLWEIFSLPAKSTKFKTELVTILYSYENP